jgi:hypothetical protein
MRPTSERIRSFGDDQVDAFAGPHVELSALTAERLGVVGPDAGALTTWRARTVKVRYLGLKVVDQARR